MTDTTDIAALRDKYELALKDVTDRLVECSRLNFCMDELTAFAAFSSTIIDQLEAERQRGEAKDNAINLATEIARTASEKIERLEAEISALKAKLANPVVLPRTLWYEHDDLPQVIPVLEKRLVIAGIHLAGFTTVKGE